ncbi:MAG: hypothetical protein A2452_06440 [Candidatus Firestonebacteria bacterium RIFOXYC2_FULL_39_67]|nr:MAG: hypothetical protein A2452_06440 [Candidatus Firestonebacteria bacterium RIFOXYC2_FULL_39_67]
MKKTTGFLFLTILVFLIAACNNKASETVKSANNKKEMCIEHGVLESDCTRCNSSLVAGFKAKGDWCGGHNLPESQCTTCNPNLALKTESEAKEICSEHGVPEKECTRCKPALVAGFKARGDWCKEHNIPDSHCLACNPDLAGKILPPAGGDPNTISVSEESKEKMGITLGTVAYKNIEEVFSVTGEIAKDTDKAFHVISKIQGKVVDVKVQYGMIVKKDSILAAISNAKTGVLEEIRSDYAGIITGVNAASGQQLDEISSLFTVSDLSNICANFDIYEKDSGKVQVGQKVKVTTAAYPDKTFTGNILFVSPRIDDTSRTLKVRAEINNNEYLLKHNMFINGKIIMAGGRFLSVPIKSVYQVKDKRMVFVAKNKSEFETREVELGFEDDVFVQIKRGLREGEIIAVDGSFLLKSELLKATMGAGCAD